MIDIKIPFLPKVPVFSADNKAIKHASKTDPS